MRRFVLVRRHRWPCLRGRLRSALQGFWQSACCLFQRIGGACRDHNPMVWSDRRHTFWMGSLQRLRRHGRPTGTVCCGRWQHIQSRHHRWIGHVHRNGGLDHRRTRFINCRNGGTRSPIYGQSTVIFGYHRNIISNRDVRGAINTHRKCRERGQWIRTRP